MNPASVSGRKRGLFFAPKASKGRPELGADKRLRSIQNFMLGPVFDLHIVLRGGNLLRKRPPGLRPVWQIRVSLPAPDNQKGRGVTVSGALAQPVHGPAAPPPASPRLRPPAARSGCFAQQTFGLRLKAFGGVRKVTILAGERFTPVADRGPPFPTPNPACLPRQV